MERKESYSLLNWILTALMIALVFLAGNVIKIPTIGGFVHVGDCMVLLSAVLLGKKRGALAAAVGMALVDNYGGYFLWAPFTFIIKGVMAYIAGDILEKFKEKTFKAYLISFITAGVFMVIGYLFAGALMASLLTGKVNGITAALVYAAKDIPGNIIQVVTGIVIALPLANVMLRARKKVFN